MMSKKGVGGRSLHQSPDRIFGNTNVVRVDFFKNTPKPARPPTLPPRGDQRQGGWIGLRWWEKSTDNNHG